MARERRVFFIHIMRTGGGTFFQLLRNNFERGEVYPEPMLDPDMATANLSVPYLLALPLERHRGIRFYTGHFPFYVTKLLGPDMLTM